MQLWDRDESVRNCAYLRTICINAIATWRRRRNQENLLPDRPPLSVDTLRLRTAARAALLSIQTRFAIAWTPGLTTWQPASQLSRLRDARRRGVGLHAALRAALVEPHLLHRGGRHLALREGARSVMTSSLGAATVEVVANSLTTSKAEAHRRRSLRPGRSPRFRKSPGFASTTQKQRAPAREGTSAPYKHIKPGAPAEDTNVAAPAPAEPAASTRRVDSPAPTPF